MQHVDAGSLGLLVLILLLYYRLRIQEEQLRVLLSFVGGLFERTVVHGEKINGISRETQQLFKDSPEYQALIYSIAAYFEQDYWAAPFKKFLLSKSDLYVQARMGNGGFNEIYRDLFVFLAKETLSENNSMFSMEEKKRLKCLVERCEESDAKRREDLCGKP